MGAKSKDMLNFHSYVINHNFIARYKFGNRNKSGLKLMHWNAGGGFLRNKLHHIESVVEQYKPHIMGISETQFKSGHDINEIKINDYDVFFSKTLANPLLNTSRVAVFVRKDVNKVELRNDLMDEDFSSIWLEIGLLRQKTILVGNAYREWQHVGQNDDSSLSISSQYDRFNKFINKYT